MTVENSYMVNKIQVLRIRTTEFCDFKDVSHMPILFLHYYHQISDSTGTIL
jgi:hypothetical protein